MWLRHLDTHSIGFTRYAFCMTALRIRYVEGVNPARWFAVWDERHPDAPLDQLRVAEPRQFEEVLAGDADAAIVRGPVTDDRLHRVRLFEERAVAVAVREHPIEAFEQVNLADLEGEQLINVAELSAEDAVAVAATGAGIAILPMSVARLFGGKSVTIRIVEDAVGYDVSLVWLQDRDDDDIQDFVGITRGRRAWSGRGSESGETDSADEKSKPSRADKAKSTTKQQRQNALKRTARPIGARGRRKPSRPKRRR